jgi:mannose-6-phosphate isomerase-like protein (cupin superfamily)
VSEDLEVSLRRPVVLGPGEGRRYSLGVSGDVVFKADGVETVDRYAISEWWLEPHTKGPPPHHHPDDDVFYVIAGTMSVLVDDEWYEAPTGSFVLVPGEMTHTFENRTDTRAGLLDISAPGGFEQNVPGIAQWFAERSPEDSRL